ncbi:hypothetical protein [Streptomyces cyaneofuscatus]
MPVGQMHWAEARTATIWSGYMGGVLPSGCRAADEVFAGLS